MYKDEYESQYFCKSNLKNASMVNDKGAQYQPKMNRKTIKEHMSRDSVSIKTGPNVFEQTSTMRDAFGKDAYQVEDNSFERYPQKIRKLVAMGDSK